MELTAKGIAALIIPAIITIAGTQVDSALKWRAELEQREYDRQMKILDKIINTENPEQRIAVAKFYLNSGTFTGLYRNELEASIMLAEREREHAEMLVAAQKAEVEEQEKLVSRMSVAPPDEDEEVDFYTPLPLPLEPPPPPRLPPQKLDIPVIGPKTIFSYDKQALE